MPGNPVQTKAIVEAVQSGALSERQLDENVARVLNIILQTPAFKGDEYSSRPDLKANAQIAREVAAEGMVLLKNEKDTLPFAPAARKVALFGYTSYELIAGGTGSGDVNKEYGVSVEQGLTAAGYALDASLKDSYTRYVADQKSKRPAVPWFLPPPPIPEMPVEPGVIDQQAQTADVAVITIGRNSGEFADRKVENDFTLSATEQTLLKNVSDAFRSQGKRVVVVLNVGGVTETASWRDLTDAILLAWQPGQEGGHAITDVLGGKVNPSGKLATTFPLAYDDVPSAKTFPGIELVGQKPYIVNPFAGKPAEVRYDEGIFVGYRFYNTRRVKTAYEFGYGLSYTEFTYSDLKLSSKQFDGKITATVTVTNNGKRAGKEIVQLYVSAPANKLEKPESELRAFAKTKLLTPGQSQTLSFTLTPAELASFDSDASAWIAEAGTYTVKIGASSLNIKQFAPFELKKERLVEKVNKVLLPKVKI
jgi:beta-glucosidase